MPELQSEPTASLSSGAPNRPAIPFASDDIRAMRAWNLSDRAALPAAASSGTHRCARVDMVARQRPSGHDGCLCHGHWGGPGRLPGDSSLGVARRSAHVPLVNLQQPLDLPQEFGDVVQRDLRGTRVVRRPTGALGPKRGGGGESGSRGPLTPDPRQFKERSRPAESADRQPPVGAR